MEETRKRVEAAGKAGSENCLNESTLYHLLLCFIIGSTYAQKAAPKPLYRDPVYDGAADPVVIWNPKVKRWWMFYTNRRLIQLALLEYNNGELTCDRNKPVVDKLRPMSK